MKASTIQTYIYVHKTEFLEGGQYTEEEKEREAEVNMIMVSQRRPCPNPQKLQISWVAWQRGIKVTSGIKFANLLALRLAKSNLGEMILNEPGRPSVITGILQSTREMEKTAG